jgi:hypothetical protein
MHYFDPLLSACMCACFIDRGAGYSDVMCW